MKTKIFCVLSAAALLTGCAATPKSVIEDAQAAMGNITSIQYSGKGTNGNFGQALLAGKEWPRRELAAYSRALNYDQKSSSETLEFAQPVFGGQKQTQIVNGDKAWNAADAGPNPQPAAAETRQLRIWMTPHGFLKGAAAAADATLTPGQGTAHTLTFTALGKYKVTGHIDSAGLVTRVESKLADPVLGDTPVIATYSDYRVFGGVKFPAHLVEEQGGYMVLDVNLDDVQPGAPVDLPVPPPVQAAAIPAPVTASTRLANGVWHVMGGSHHSLVVEFADFLAVVEAPLNDARAAAVIVEAKNLVPDKPINYVVSTHHHFDHSGGLRAFVAEGATIVTHASNVPYFTAAFNNPAAIAPDSLARSPKPAKFAGVTGKYTITDGTQSIDVYPTVGDNHTDELLIAYLPGPRILMEADSYSPNDPNARPMPPPPNAVSLYDNIERLKLNVSFIAPVHGRGQVPIAEFRRFVGR